MLPKPVTWKDDVCEGTLSGSDVFFFAACLSLDSAKFSTWKEALLKELRSLRPSWSDIKVVLTDDWSSVPPPLHRCVSTNQARARRNPCVDHGEDGHTITKIVFFLYFVKRNLDFKMKVPPTSCHQRAASSLQNPPPSMRLA